MIEEYLNEVLLFLLLVAGLPLTAATVCGLFAATIQALFQIQEQTLLFLIRIVSAAIVLLLTAAPAVSRIELLVTKSITLISKGAW